MKHILSAAAVALAFAVSINAQTPSQTAPQPTPQSQPATPHKAHKTQKSSNASKQMNASASMVTLTGCLKQGDTPNAFELADAQVTSSASSSAEQSQTGSSTASASTATTGTSGTSMGTVKLMPNPDIDMKDHVGHKVEVRGNLVDSKAKGPGTKASDKGSATGDTMGSASGASSSSATGTSGTGQEKQLKVRAFRHVSENCSQ